MSPTGAPPGGAKRKGRSNAAFSFLSGLYLLFNVVFPAESLNTASCIDQFLLPRKEGVAG